MNYFSVILSIFLFSNCWSQTSKSILKKYPIEVQKIIKEENGIFRGSDFGDTKAMIKSREIVTLQGESDSTLTYTISIDSDDSADLVYYMDKTEKAKSFAIIFILQDVNQEKNLKIYLTKYYNEKFGAFEVINEEDELWASKEGYFVEMKDTSDEAGMEIEIVYFKK
ncbi:MAG: hypothetical protein H7329_17740 [Opitutaceae bacterium]|nr:hypothetical protein [Cytophagales bacterium]